MKLRTICITCITCISWAFLIASGTAGAQQETTVSDQTNGTAGTTAEAIPAPTVGITDIRIGSGAEAVEGARIGVHYTGWLYDAKARKFHGKKFDSSYDRHLPVFLVLGEHRVIQGWEQGLPGMKVGGRRTLVIPSALAYGATGVKGLIPPDATLIFDVELVSAAR